MKKIKTYEEFLKMTAKEADDLVHYAMKNNKVDFATDLAKWLAKVQTEHVLNFVETGAFEAKDLYEYAYGNKEKENV